MDDKTFWHIKISVRSIVLTILFSLAMFDFVHIIYPIQVNDIVLTTEDICSMGYTKTTNTYNTSAQMKYKTVNTSAEIMQKTC